jgi:ketosteroid isomerase-like protein
LAGRELEALRSVYEAWARGEYGWADVFAAEMEFVYSSDFPEPAVYTGPEGIAAGWREWLREFDDVRVEARELVQAGPETVLAWVTVSGQGRGSGARAAQPGANVWRFSGGRAVRVELFFDPAAAERAAGLR